MPGRRRAGIPDQHAGQVRWLRRKRSSSPASARPTGSASPPTVRETAVPELSDTRSRPAHVAQPSADGPEPYCRWRSGGHVVEAEPQHPQPTQLRQPVQAILVAMARRTSARSGPLSVENGPRTRVRAPEGNLDSCSRWAPDRSQTGIQSTLRQPLRRCSSDSRVGVWPANATRVPAGPRLAH